ncbi:MAG: DUF3021 domain-containing protein [Vagococcus sp.]
MKKILKRIINGIPLGVFIGLIISYVISLLLDFGIYYPAPPNFTNRFETELNALGVSIILWGLIGVMFSVASLIYERDDWSILKQTVLHFCTMYIGMISFGLLAGWFTSSLKELMVVTLIFVFIYLIIWLVSMLKARRTINSVNKQLKKIHKKE